LAQASLSCLAFLILIPRQRQSKPPLPQNNPAQRVGR
jgi:hypothetical protein